MTDTTLIGPPPPPGNSGYSNETAATGTLGSVFAVSGAIVQAIGAFYAADAQKAQARSAELRLRFQETLANLNARAAELDAQQALRAAQRAAGRSDLQYRAFASSAKVQQARAGIQAGVGSAGEVQASIELARQQDRISITMNGVRAANAARTRATAFRNQATAAGASAQMASGFGSLINPGLAAGSSLLGSSASLVRTFGAASRDQRRFGGN